MLDNTLSICLIVKNEEKNLERCLSSITHIADEIIVVDTGSEDNTIEIAKKFGAKVIVHPWKDDFSDARNKSIEFATKTWILFLDADEEMPYDDGLMLKTILAENSQFEAFHLRLVNVISGTNTGDAIVLRVFKNKPQYRFRGRMHEQIITIIEKLNPPGVVGATDVRILHYGYDPDLCDINKKQKRNLDLLNSFPEEERDGYFYYSLGNEYARVNEFDKALEIYDQTLQIELPPGASPIYVPYLYLNICKVLFNSQRFIDINKKVDEFTKHHPNFKDLYFYNFLAYSQSCYFKEAKAELEKYIYCPSGKYEYPCSNFESQYNFDEIIANLTKTCVNHKENLISVVIMVDEDSSSISEAIKGVNEIADEVIVLCNEDVEIKKEIIENIGGKVLKVSSKDKGEIFMSGIKNCKGDFILLLKPNEFLTFEIHKYLVDHLSNTNDSYFNVSILDTKTNVTSDAFRLFRNDEKLSEFTNFMDLSEYIYSNEIKYFPLYIQKIYFD